MTKKEYKELVYNTFLNLKIILETEGSKDNVSGKTINSLIDAVETTEYLAAKLYSSKKL